MTLSLGPRLSLEAEVVTCDLVEADGEIMEMAYLIRCRFLDEDVGRFLLMNLLEPELELHQRAAKD